MNASSLMNSLFSLIIFMQVPLLAYDNSRQWSNNNNAHAAHEKLIHDSLYDFQECSLEDLLTHLETSQSIDNQEITKKIIQTIEIKANDTNPSWDSVENAKKILGNIQNLNYLSPAQNAYVNQTNSGTTLIDPIAFNATFCDQVAKKFNYDYKQHLKDDDRCISAYFWLRKDINTTESLKPAATFLAHHRNGQTTLFSECNIQGMKPQLLMANILDLKNAIQLPTTPFEWHKVTNSMHSHGGTLQAFATSKHLLIMPSTPLILQHLDNQESNNNSAVKIPLLKSYILNLSHPETACTHIAFSHDDAYITYIKNGTCYVLNKKDNAVQKIRISLNLMSALLINNTLLLRTPERNTYAYDMQNSTIKHVPTHTPVDYFLGAQQDTILANKNHYYIFGLRKMENNQISFAQDLLPL